MSGRVLHLQRLSTEDGPGIRTTVFFKGCPLRCAWCHNPESISPRPQVQWLENRCLGCGTCVGVCANGGVSSPLTPRPLPLEGRGGRPRQAAGVASSPSPLERERARGEGGGNPSHIESSIIPKPEKRTCSPGAEPSRRSVSTLREGDAARGTGEGGGNHSHIEIDRQLCQGCGTCAEACPANALELLGRSVEAGALLKELAKDRAYYERSGGGVTLSGGEPTLQAGFAEEVLAGLRGLGLHTALDTCGLCAPETLARLLPLVDLVLYDLKLIDGAEHEQFTGAGNARILENLLSVAEHQRTHAGRPALWVRTPLIPGATAAEGNLAGLGAWIGEHLAGSVERWELTAFNNLCRDKYRRLGLTWAYADTPLMTVAELRQCEAWAQAGARGVVVRATGGTKSDA